MLESKRVWKETRVYHVEQNRNAEMITVKYFASLREEMGRSEDGFDAGPLHTVADVWRAAAGDRPLEDMLCAVNRRYAKPGTQVADGDEVAFFPPVTGG